MYKKYDKIKRKQSKSNLKIIQQLDFLPQKARIKKKTKIGCE